MIGNIYISGQIGSFDGETGVELIDVVSQVKKQPQATAYNVHINSEGGLVDVGFDIYHYLRSLGKPITTIGSGIVASIATVVFMAGDKRVVRENTPFMIHLPWGGSMGTADELEKFADQLRAIEKKMLSFYKNALDVTDEAISPLLKNETWLNKEQLKVLGFITEDIEPVAVKAIIKTKKDDKKMSKFSDDDKNWLEGLFGKVLSKFKGIKAKLVQDATGTEINFEELSDGDAVTKGAKATIDGQPAEGEHVMPDGTTYIFVAGELTEIKEAEEDADMAALQQKIEALEEQNETLASERDEAVKEAGTLKAQLKMLKKDVTDLKAKVMSRYTPDSKTNPERGKKRDGKGNDRAAGAREYLDNKRNR